MDSNTNPYLSPHANDGPASPLLRWRLFPASFVGIVGSLSLAFGLWGVLMPAFALLTEGNGSVEQGYWTVCIMYLGLGVFWIASGLLVWKTRYFYATIMLLVGVAVAMTFQP